MNHLTTKILFFISLGLFIIVMIAFLILSRSQQQNDNPSHSQVPIPTPIPTVKKNSHPEERPFPSPNPTYIALLETQPFWDMLPHYTDVYVVEHIMHSDTIRITTIDPSGENRNELILQYREQARDWLTQNGAILNELTIEYVPNNL